MKKIKVQPLKYLLQMNYVLGIDCSRALEK